MSRRRGKMPTIAYVLIPLFAIGTVCGLVYIANRLSNAWAYGGEIRPKMERDVQEIEDYANWGWSKDD
jgi:hypothetical protein